MQLTRMNLSLLAAGVAGVGLVLWLWHEQRRRGAALLAAAELQARQRAEGAPGAIESAGPSSAGASVNAPVFRPHSAADHTVHQGPSEVAPASSNLAPQPEPRIQAFASMRFGADEARAPSPPESIVHRPRSPPSAHTPASASP